MESIPLNLIFPHLREMGSDGEVMNSAGIPYAPCKGSVKNPALRYESKTDNGEDSLPGSTAFLVIIIGYRTMERSLLGLLPSIRELSQVLLLIPAIMATINWMQQTTMPSLVMKWVSPSAPSGIQEI